MTYSLLFASAFLAATILPFYSEVVLFAMIRAGEPAGLLLALATAGNTLGAVVNWGLGRYLLHFQHRKWFYFKPAQIQNMQAWFQKYGVWSLLLAWMPIGGDPLTLVAGIMRVNLWLFIMLVGLGKMLRYVAVIYFSEMSVAWF